MFAFPEQFSNATKANLDAQFAMLTALTSKAFEGMEKLVELNITAAKATLEESSQAAKQLLSAKDPRCRHRKPSRTLRKPCRTAARLQRLHPAPRLNSAALLKSRSPRPTARSSRWLTKSPATLLPVRRALLQRSRLA